MYDCRQLTALQELESLLLQQRMLDTDIIVCGDLNARTSDDAKDYINYDINAPYTDDFAELPGGDIGDVRVSSDSIINKLGK